MNLKLFWKLCMAVVLGSTALVYLVSSSSSYVEGQLSLVAPEHKVRMKGYQAQADKLVQSGNPRALETWVQQVRAQENTFVAVVHIRSQVLAGAEPSASGVQLSEPRLGRRLDWPIHLHHNDNPHFDLPLSEPGTSLIFQLPDYMMPGRYWPLIHDLLHFGVPLMLMLLLCVAIYRHVMRPLQQLERATQHFADGELAVRLTPQMRGRSDELGRLAVTFDTMATQVGGLIQTQRHLINDLSHELRTPLQRIELCLVSEGAGQDVSPSMVRLQREVFQMRRLVEDTLTLAWLQNESPCLRLEAVDLSALLDAIAEDCRFEYPDRTLRLEMPDELVLNRSSERALNLSLENLIRNALRHTPVGGDVLVSVTVVEGQCVISVSDQGPGVPDDLLEMIFKPFFRVDKSRDREAGGFGLGLALARRQIEGMDGHITAKNCAEGGLCLRVSLPV